jgi:hypothetical protein
MPFGLTEWEAEEMDAEYLKKVEARQRKRQLRIQALGAAISQKDWHAVGVAYNAIRDAFDRPEIYDAL